MGGAVAAWAAFWLVPTEVVGKGVLLLPDNAGLLDARAAGQVRRLPIRVGDRVQRGQVLVELYLPVLEKELEQQRANLRELERQNRALDERDRLRLQSEQLSVDTSLAKLQSDRERYGSLRDIDASELRRFDWLSRCEVVAPLSSDVVSTEQGLTTAGVNLDQVRIEQKKVLTAYQQVKRAIETAALQRL
jgi:HlyD family secretion protein